jgi:hypothetical protein
MSAFNTHNDDRKPTPPTRATRTMRPDCSSPRSRKTGLSIAAALTAVVAAAILGPGQLGYAATSVTRAVQTAAHLVTAQSAVAPLSSAAGQYGEKIPICGVGANGKQHTISIARSVEAAYLAGHPSAFVGSCGVFRPHGVKANVCITIRGRHHAAVFVTAGQLGAYLKRNPHSYTTKTGICVRH